VLQKNVAKKKDVPNKKDVENVRSVAYKKDGAYISGVSSLCLGSCIARF
jgi:hypothetical protein